MNREFKHEVGAALEDFLHRIMGAAEREAVKAMETAFGQMAVRTITAEVVPSTRGEAGRFDGPKPDGLPVRSAGVREDQRRLIVQLRAKPGSTVAELSSALGLSIRRLRPHLRTLVQDGALRMEERSSGFGGPRSRVFFVPEPIRPIPAVPRDVTTPSTVCDGLSAPINGGDANQAADGAAGLHPTTKALLSA